MTELLTRVRRRLVAEARLPELAPLRERLARLEADVAEERGLRLRLEDQVAALERTLGAAYGGAGGESLVRDQGDQDDQDDPDDQDDQDEQDDPDDQREG